MNTDIQYAAHEAVYGLQLNFSQAIKFIARNARVDNSTAKKALKAALTGYKDKETQ